MKFVERSVIIVDEQGRQVWTRFRTDGVVVWVWVSVLIDVNASGFTLDFLMEPEIHTDIDSNHGSYLGVRGWSTILNNEQIVAVRSVTWPEMV